MRTKYEYRGLQLEIFGLFLLLAATFWESEYSGWWDKQSPEWQYYIQEEVNLSVLSALSDIASISAISDEATKKSIANNASEKASKALFRAIEMRDERKKGLDGQAALFSKIKLWLFGLGATLIIIGKYLFLQAYKRDV